MAALLPLGGGYKTRQQNTKQDFTKKNDVYENEKRLKKKFVPEPTEHK